MNPLDKTKRFGPIVACDEYGNHPRENVGGIYIRFDDPILLAIAEEARWRPVVGYEGRYEVRDDGAIRSIVRRVRSGSGSRLVGGTIVKPQIDKGGYLQVSLYFDSEQRHFFVHRVVAEAFIGPRPSGMQVNHKDGNKNNNSADNLEYVTQSENHRHAFKTGLRQNPSGESHHMARLTNEQARSLYLDSMSGVDTKTLSDRYSLSRNAVRDIVLGKRWKNVTADLRALTEDKP